MSSKNVVRGGVLVVSFVMAAACSSSREGGGDAPRFDPGPADGGSCDRFRCSPDLRRVLSGCDGTLIRECGPLEGCANGGCIPACESAAQSQGSIGCSFWTTPAPVSIAMDYYSPDGERGYGIRNNSSCFAAFVANTWTAPITLRAEYGSEPLDISRATYKFSSPAQGQVHYEPIGSTLAPGEVAVVLLNQDERPKLLPDYSNYALVSSHTDCPPGLDVAHRGPLASRAHASSIDKAFHITADLPVSAYAIYPYGGAASFFPSATLLLPSTAWGTNYLLVGPAAQWSQVPSIQIIAQQDDTEVRIRPRARIAATPSIPATMPEELARYTLARGQVLELAQDLSLSGSPLESNHPVAVFGGAGLLNVPSLAVQAADGAQQQLPPLTQWGSSYAAVGYESRTFPKNEPIYWQIVAAENGTVLEYTPRRPEGAPEKLDRGGIAAFSSVDPFRVKSQDANHPFHLSLYMSGGDLFGGEGDPEFVNVVPLDQYLDRYVFFVDYTYPNSSITLVRKRGPNGFDDVLLDCAGVVTGWRPLDDEGATEYAWVELTRESKPVASGGGKECNYGRREATSASPFGVHVWGIGPYASYSYPGGAGTRPVSSTRIEVR